MGLAVCFPGEPAFHRSALRRRAPSSSRSENAAAFSAQRRARSRARKTGVVPYLPPLVRDPSAGSRLRHPHGAGAARPCRRQDHDDLYTRAEPRRPRCSESARCGRRLEPISVRAYFSWPCGSRCVCAGKRHAVLTALRTLAKQSRDDEEPTVDATHLEIASSLSLLAMTG